MRRRKTQLEREAMEAAEREAERLRQIEEAKKREEERLRREEERKKRELQRAAEEQKNAILDLADEEGVERELTPEEKQHVKEREAIEKLINEKPAEVAMLVKTWLSED